MKKRVLSGAAACGLLLLGAAAWPQDPGKESIAFQRDPKESVVASRLQGTWELDPALTNRLGGSRSKPDLTFTVDWSVIPDRVFDQLAELAAKREIKLTIYLTGLAKGLHEGQVPFFLTTIQGNPQIHYFRERDRDPFGDLESFNVMLAPGAARKDDLLFRGGDFNNQPFTAYKRKGK